MSHPNPSHDRENEYKSDLHTGARSKALSKMKKKSKYDAMINPSKAHKNSPLGRLHNLLNG